MMQFTIYENAVFHTFDDEVSTPSALVSANGRIQFLGSVQEAHEFAPQAKRVNLAGAYAMSGFTDSHMHTAQLALRRAELDLSAVNSASEAVALVGAHAASLDPTDTTSWIFGGRWNHQGWTNNALPDRFELDAVTSTHPTALHHSDLHTYWLNSAALCFLGIDAATPDPAGGTIVRDATGAATGILLEAAGFQAGSKLEEVTRENLAAFLPPTLRALVSQGITSIHDLDGLDAWDTFFDLHERGELPLRVNKIMPVSALDSLIEQGVRTGQGDSWLRRGGVKIFSDGSLSSGTCLMHAPYGPAHSEGLAVTAKAELNRLVALANHNGISAAVHAIGDRAVSNALDAFELAATQPGSKPAGANRIEHVQHLAPKDLHRLASTGTLACMQPASCTSDIEMVDDLLANHEVLSYPWASIINAGGSVAFSSDAPVEETNPFHGLFAAITRQRHDGFPAGGWQPEEILTREQALRAATSSNTIATGESDLKGTLSVGKLADFVVLDRDPLTSTPLALRSTQVNMTVIDGEIRWSD